MKKKKSLLTNEDTTTAIVKQALANNSITDHPEQNRKPVVTQETHMCVAVHRADSTEVSRASRLARDRGSEREIEARERESERGIEAAVNCLCYASTAAKCVCFFTWTRYARYRAPSHHPPTTTSRTILVIVLGRLVRGGYFTLEDGSDPMSF